MCFECLQRRIREDLSDRLIFCHGLSDSHLPFGSSAVVRLESSSAEPSPEFVVKYVPYQKGDCLAKFVYVMNIVCNFLNLVTVTMQCY